jgi:hypothetical protein
MTSIKIQYLALPVESAPWGTDPVLLGTGELDPAAVSHLDDHLLVLRQVPDQLRELADQLESGMTTGPDACGSAAWLQP